jgi:hypothetical protein
MLIVAVSVCEQLNTSITAFSVQHLSFVSTLSTNEGTNQFKSHSSQSKNSPIFLEPEGSLPCSQEREPD